MISVMACCAPNKPSLESRAQEELRGAKAASPRARWSEPGKRATADAQLHRGDEPPAYGAPLLGPAVVVPWRQLPTAEIVDVAPSDGRSDGGETRPVRPYLVLEGSPAGWAGRVMQGDGTASAVAVRGGEAGAQVIVIGPDALAVSARRDGMWALFRDRLVHWGDRGEVRQKVALPSGAARSRSLGMIGGERDAVWLVAEAQVWRVDRNGAMRGPYAWTRRPGAFAQGEALCQPEERSQRLECLQLEEHEDEHGAHGEANEAHALQERAIGASLDDELAFGGAMERGGLVRPLAEGARLEEAGAQRTRAALAFPLARGESVLWSSGPTSGSRGERDGRGITGSAAGDGPPMLTSRRGGAPSLSLAIAAAGLDAGQRSFAVTSEGVALAVWRQSVRGRSLEASAEGRRFSSEIGLPEAASIEGAEVAFYARGQRSAHRGDWPLVMSVDEERYRHEVFPASWALSPRGAVAVWGRGEVAVATSGPDGIAVIPVYFSAP